MAVNTQPIIRLTNVTKSYGEHQVLKNINLDLEAGKFYTLLGPSGCGKTTILRTIAGFTDATSGQVYFDGQVINDLPANQRQVNTVFQDYALFPHMNVAENVAFGLKLHKVPKDEIETRVQKALAMVQLADLGEREISEISGGQQQRVAIARALVMQPKVLLLDEPLSALDAKLRKDMQYELRDLQQRLGITFLFVTHDQEEALAMSDEIFVMNAGEILQGGPQLIFTMNRSTISWRTSSVKVTLSRVKCSKILKWNLSANNSNAPMRECSLMNLSKSFFGPKISTLWPQIKAS
ncbi:hypothetical protein AGMB00912_00275 [Lactiplantibacillus argentoratensis]